MVINHSGNWNERRPFKELDKRGIYSDKIYINEGGNFRDVSEEVGLENDRYGKTKKYLFDNFTECSPTNLRYIFLKMIYIRFKVFSTKNFINFIR